MGVNATVRRRAAAVIVACLLLFALAGCGSSSGSADATNTPPGRSPKALSAVFDALPHYPRSRATSARTRGDQGTLVRSYLVEGASTQQVLDYFVKVLPRQSFEPAGIPTTQGTDSLRGEWRLGKRTLVLTITPAPTAGDTGASGEVTTQYSFLLAPAGVSVP
jgi:hypothetical protein